MIHKQVNNMHRPTPFACVVFRSLCFECVLKQPTVSTRLVVDVKPTLNINPVSVSAYLGTQVFALI